MPNKITNINKQLIIKQKQLLNFLYENLKIIYCFTSINCSNNEQQNFNNQQVSVLSNVIATNLNLQNTLQIINFHNSSDTNNDTDVNIYNSMNGIMDLFYYYYILKSIKTRIIFTSIDYSNIITITTETTVNDTNNVRTTRNLLLGEETRIITNPTPVPSQIQIELEIIASSFNIKLNDKNMDETINYGETLRDIIIVCEITASKFDISQPNRIIDYEFRNNFVYNLLNKTQTCFENLQNF